MANWSSDTYYFGRLLTAIDEYADYEALRQEVILPNVAFEANSQQPYVVTSIALLGECAVCLEGNGKYGCGIHLTDESWSRLNEGVVVYEGYDGFSDHVDFCISIAGERVLELKLPFVPDDDSPEALERFDAEHCSVKFVGRSEAERHFFVRFWQARADKLRRNLADQRKRIDKLRAA